MSAYIARFPMNRDNGVGPGDDLEHGEQLYVEYCAKCHGDHGEGVAKDHMPLIQGQHYRYLVRQFEWIRDGKRRNADLEMVKQIRSFTPRDVSAIMDYTSRLHPPAERVGTSDYRNPDFPGFWRLQIPASTLDDGRDGERPSPRAAPLAFSGCASLHGADRLLCTVKLMVVRRSSRSGVGRKRPYQDHPARSCFGDSETLIPNLFQIVASCQGEDIRQ